MTTELSLLLASAALGLVQIFVSGAAATRQRGVKYNLGARDAQPPPLTGVAARLDRASNNFKETFPIAAVAIIAAHLAGVHTTVTLAGSQLYFWGRLVYVPLYAFGVPVVRTLAWAAATLGIILLMAATVLAK